MSAGAPAQPCVAAGDSVREGDLIAAAPEGKLGANVHASIAGVVTEVSDRIVIEKGGAEA
jgi:Na+-translocating ferredoxin:NAD+ oxidoreductase RnfC subunit